MVVRRLKTYTSETGNVYEYYFVGKRPALADEPLAPATEFIFDVRSASEPTVALSIFLREHSVEGCRRDNGRGLVEPEQYGVAKMKLFRVFDEIESLREPKRKFAIEAEELSSLLADLGID